MSQYEKTNWKKGDTISSERMNKIEDQIERLSDTEGIANNLSRLLGSTGSSIQEILENTDSIINAFPMIEFISSPDPDDNTKQIVTLGESRGIFDRESFLGLCLIKSSFYLKSGQDKIEGQPYLGYGIYTNGITAPNGTIYSGGRFVTSLLDVAPGHFSSASYLVVVQDGKTTITAWENAVDGTSEQITS